MKDAKNPNHPVTKELEDQWHKLLAIAMHKLDYDRIVITEADALALADKPEMSCLIAHAHPDAIELILMTESEVEPYAKKHGLEI